MEAEDEFDILPEQAVQDDGHVSDDPGDVDIFTLDKVLASSSDGSSLGGRSDPS